MRCPLAARAAAGSSSSAARTASSSICGATATTTGGFSISRSTMTESLLDAVVVVLHEPQNPINIAATVRAMKNMGIGRLRVVRPVDYDVVKLEGIAHGTMDLIERIERFDSFDEAVADCIYVAGFTARRRSAKLRIIDPKTVAAESLAAAANGP